LEQLQPVDHFSELPSQLPVFLVNRLLLQHKQAYLAILPNQAHNKLPLQHLVAYLALSQLHQVVCSEPLQQLIKNPYLVLKQNLTQVLSTTLQSQQRQALSLAKSQLRVVQFSVHQLEICSVPQSPKVVFSALQTHCSVLIKVPPCSELLKLANHQ
jgi:hypothetical protein